jgi:hypothetical protein
MSSPVPNTFQESSIEYVAIEVSHSLYNILALVNVHAAATDAV